MNTTKDSPSKYKQKVTTLAEYGNINGTFLLSSSPAKMVLLFTCEDIYIYLYRTYRQKGKTSKKKEKIKHGLFTTLHSFPSPPQSSAFPVLTLL